MILLLFLINWSYTSVRNSLLSEEEKWLEDLDYLSAVLVEMHADFDLYADSALFARHLEDTRFLIQSKSSSDTKKNIAFMEIVALLNDPHTRVNNLPEVMDSIYPYYILWFDDGPHLVLAPNEHELYLGAKVLAMDGKNMNEVYNSLKTVVPHSNDTGYKDDMVSYLRIPELLHGMGLANNDTTLTLHLEMPDGKSDSLTFHAMNRDEWNQFNNYTSIRSDWEAGTYPLFQQNRSHNYWYSHLVKNNVLYIKYNLANDDERISGNKFWEEILLVADSVRAEKLILDARGNGGGDNYFHLPLVKGIKSRPWLNHPNKLFTLYDRGTFSAAITFVADMEKETNTTFAGEYLGDRPNTTGDTRYFTLPHSGMQVGIATIRWENTHAYDNRESVEPDIYIGKYFTDYASGIDPVIETVMNYSGTDIPDDTLLQITDASFQENHQLMLSPFQRLRITGLDSNKALLHISGFAEVKLKKIAERTYTGHKYGIIITLPDSSNNQYEISFFDTTLTLGPSSGEGFDLFTELHNNTLLDDSNKLIQLKNVKDGLHLLDRTKLNMLAFQAFYYDENEQLAKNLITLNELLNGDDPFVYIRKAQLQDLTQMGSNFWSYIVTGVKIFKRYFTVEYMNDHYLPF